MVAPRRTVRPEDIDQRGFGETIYSTKTPAQRATEIQANDLAEMQAMILNRKNQMAAEILTTGAYTIKGYADDGTTVKTAKVTFDWNQKITPTTTWDQANASIYSDLKNASSLIQENAGVVPTVAIVGKNVADYMLGNDQIMKWLAVPSNTNLSLMSIQPRIESPQVARIGLIQSLSLRSTATWRPIRMMEGIRCRSLVPMMSSSASPDAAVSSTVRSRSSTIRRADSRPIRGSTSRSTPHRRTRTR